VATAAAAAAAAAPRAPPSPRAVEGVGWAADAAWGVAADGRESRHHVPCGVCVCVASRACRVHGGMETPLRVHAAEKRPAAAEKRLFERRASVGLHRRARFCALLWVAATARSSSEQLRAPAAPTRLPGGLCAMCKRRRWQVGRVRGAGGWGLEGRGQRLMKLAFTAMHLDRRARCGSWTWPRLVRVSVWRWSCWEGPGSWGRGVELGES
jgi:hypothetical protein